MLKRVIALSQIVAFKMVNKCVKFHKIILNGMEVMMAKKNNTFSKSVKWHNIV